MKKVAELVNAMRDAGVVSEYAIFGAVAQMRYTEAVATFDADVLVAVPEPDRLDVLTPIYEFCQARGWLPEGEAVRVDNWPVQFIPVFDALTRESLEQAETAVFEGTPLRVVTADYLAAIALSVGRAKDFARILALLEAHAVSQARISELAAEHGLAANWMRFKQRFLDAE